MLNEPMRSLHPDLLAAHARLLTKACELEMALSLKIRFQIWHLRIARPN